MPDLSQCEQKNGKLYCWDNDDKQFVLVNLTPIKTEQVPPDVIVKFMSKLAKAGGAE